MLICTWRGVNIQSCSWASDHVLRNCRGRDIKPRQILLTIFSLIITTTTYIPPLHPFQPIIMDTSSSSFDRQATPSCCSCSPLDNASCLFDAFQHATIDTKIRLYQGICALKSAIHNVQIEWRKHYVLDHRAKSEIVCHDENIGDMGRYLAVAEEVTKKVCTKLLEDLVNEDDEARRCYCTSTSCACPCWRYRQNREAVVTQLDLVGLLLTSWGLEAPWIGNARQEVQSIQTRLAIAEDALPLLLDDTDIVHHEDPDFFNLFTAIFDAVLVETWEIEAAIFPPNFILPGRNHEAEMQEEHHSLSSTWVNTAIKPIDELKMMTVFDICLKYSRSPREVRGAYKRLLREEALAYPVTEAMRMDTNNNSIHDRDMNSDSTGPRKECCWIKRIRMVGTKRGKIASRT